MRIAVEQNALAQDRWIAAKMRSPIAVREHNGPLALRIVVGTGEKPANLRRNAENRQQFIRGEKSGRLFGLASACNARAAACPHAHRFKGALLIGHCEIDRWSHIEIRDLD